MTVLEISCLDVWREVSNFNDDTLTAEMRFRIEAHLRVCEHCTAIYDGTRNVIRLVTDGEIYEVPAGFGERLRRRLEKRFKE